MADKKELWTKETGDAVQRGVNKLPGWAEKLRKVFTPDSSNSKELDKSRMDGSERKNSQRESGNT